MPPSAAPSKARSCSCSASARRQPGGREELFSAWRTFFERIADRATTVLVFEDLQWADPGLLDFIDHLLEWSAAYPIYVVTLARPELLERRADWGAGRRNFIAIALQPLPEPAMRLLLLGLVPGLPELALRAILERADGIPLYAVETVRMLVAQGRLTQVEDRYVPQGDLTGLAVPESLQALIAARLDALDAPDRSMLQAGAVLGQTFPLAALSALTGDPPAALEPRLRALARREIVALDTDPQSPERGQWGFTQALIREVAYSTLSKKERRARHVAAARYFEGLEDEEVSGMLATHYLDAYLASPEGDEADALAAQARVALRAAAERAGKLGSHEQALAYLKSALETGPGPDDEANLLDQATREALQGGLFVQAEAIARRAAPAHEALGHESAAIVALARVADSLISRFEPEPALEVLIPAVARAEALGDDLTAVQVEAQLARAYMFNERNQLCIEWADRTLIRAEHLGDVAVIADVFVTKGMAMANTGRLREGIALVEAGERLADANDLPNILVRAQANLSAIAGGISPAAAIEAGQRAWETGRKAGARFKMALAAGNALEAAVFAAGSPWAEQAVDSLLQENLDPAIRISLLSNHVVNASLRGRPYETEEAELRELTEAAEAGSVAAYTRGYDAMWLDFIAGDYETAGRQALELAELSSLNAPITLVIAARAGALVGDAVLARDALGRLAALGVRGPTIDATREAVEAAILALDGRWADARPAFERAMRRLAAVGLDLDVGIAWLLLLRLAPRNDTLSERAEMEARAIFERLEARPFLAQLDRSVAERDGGARMAAGERAREGARV